jgi:hypothetical protein
VKTKEKEERQTSLKKRASPAKPFRAGKKAFFDILVFTSCGKVRKKNIFFRLLYVFLITFAASFLTLKYG